MRMALIGKIQEFNPVSERISMYLERVELFFTANDEKQVSVFFSIIGGKNYTLLGNLLVPTKPATKSFVQLKAVLMKHFDDNSREISISPQKPGRWRESNVAGYEVELCKLATHCAFDDYLSEVIRDRTVCGLCNKSIQKRLLAEDGLTLAKTIEMAQGMEAANCNALRLRSSELKINKVTVDPKGFYHCGSE